MTEEIFGNKVTVTGQNVYADALANGTTVVLKDIALGDSNGTYYTPAGDETSLVNEVHRINVTEVYKDPLNNGAVIVKGEITNEIGGFTIRETAVYDDAGNMITIGKYPATEIPASTQGAVSNTIIKLVFKISNDGNPDIFFPVTDNDSLYIRNQYLSYYDDGTRTDAEILTGATYAMNTLGKSLIIDQPVDLGGETIDCLGVGLVWFDRSNVITNGKLINYGELNTPNQFKTIQGLRDSSGLIEDELVQVSGYYEPADGGGGPMRVWKTGAVGEFIDNGGSVIVPTGGDGSGAWVWEYSGAVNVKWFGASPSLEDNQPMIQAAINSGYSVITGSAGEYETLSPIYITLNDISLDGGLAGEFTSSGMTIKNVGTGSTIIFATGTTIYDSVIKNIGLYSNNGHALEFAGTAARCRFLDLDLYTAALDKSCIYAEGLISCVFDGGQYKVSNSLSRTEDIVKLKSNGGSINDNTFRNMWFYNAYAKHAVYLYELNSQTYIYNNVFRDITVERSPAGFIRMGGTFGTILDNVNMYDAPSPYTADIIKIDGNTEFSQNRGTVINNYSRMGGALEAGVNDISLGHSTQTKIDNVHTTEFNLTVDYASKSCLVVGRIPDFEANVLNVVHIGSDGVTFGNSGDKGGLFLDNDNVTLLSGSEASGRLVIKDIGDTTCSMLVNGNSTYGVNGVVYPEVDNTTNFGLATHRWANIYAGTGTINTSDAREKVFLEIATAEREAAKELKDAIRKFKFSSAIDRKGEGTSRIHFGVSAQEVGDIMLSHGLDPARYAFFCYDKWDDDLDSDGNIITIAGDRYGIRYEELLCFIIGAL
jgi:hypothetical protein